MWAGSQRNTDGDDGICGKSMATFGASLLHSHAALEQNLVLSEIEFIL